MKRAEAKAQGLVTYTTGKPCAQGHYSERRTKCSNCIECTDIRRRVWQSANPGESTRQSALWRQRNPEQNRLRCRVWDSANRGKRAAALATRRAAQKNRTPVWADLAQIRAVYEEARIMTEMLGEPWHVDHIIPLQGELVSGLHVRENLQVIPGAENSAKGNRFIAA